MVECKGRRGNSSAHLLFHEKSDAMKQQAMDDFLNKLQPVDPSYTTSQILSLTSLDTNVNFVLLMFAVSSVPFLITIVTCFMIVFNHLPV
jgi:hypothetical protein